MDRLCGRLDRMAPNHAVQDFEANGEEIQRAVALAQQFPDIVKVIAVGNEAMVHWAASYFRGAQGHPCNG